MMKMYDKNSFFFHTTTHTHTNRCINSHQEYIDDSFNDFSYSDDAVNCLIKIKSDMFATDTKITKKLARLLNVLKIML